MWFLLQKSKKQKVYIRENVNFVCKSLHFSDVGEQKSEKAKS